MARHGIGIATARGRLVAIALCAALSAGLFRTLHNDAANSPGKIFVFTLEH